MHSTVALNHPTNETRAALSEQTPPDTHFVKVPGLTRWVVVGTRPEYYKEIAGAPDHQITLRMATEEVPATLPFPVHL